MNPVQINQLTFSIDAIAYVVALGCSPSLACLLRRRENGCSIFCSVANTPAQWIFHFAIIYGASVEGSHISNILPCIRTPRSVYFCPS